MPTRLAVLSLVVTAACTPPDSMNASDPRDAIEVKSSIFLPVMYQQQLVAGVIYLADVPDLCGAMKSGRAPSQLRGLTLLFAHRSSTHPSPPDVGDYAIESQLAESDGRHAVGVRLQLDDTCTNLVPPEQRPLTAGTLSIDALEARPGGLVSGSFESRYREHENMSGRFTAEYCELSNQPLTCR